MMVDIQTQAIQEIHIQISIIYQDYNNKLMKGAKMKKSADKELSIKGRNFDGSFKLSKDTVTLTLNAFESRQAFVLQITNQTLAKQPKKYFIFKKVEDLVYELTSNEGMEISDQKNLMIPVPVTYRGKLYQSILELPLKPDKSKSQVESQQKNIEVIEKRRKYEQEQEQQSSPHPEIIFHGDPANKKLFHIDTNAKTIKLIGGKNQSYIFNSREPLPYTACYFKFRVIKTANRNIWFGICGKGIKSEPNSQYSKEFMGYCLKDGRLYANGLRYSAVPNPKLVVGQTSIKVYINPMFGTELGWIMNHTMLHYAKFCEELKSAQVYPFVSLKDPGDIVEILSM